MGFLDSIIRRLTQLVCGGGNADNERPHPHQPQQQHQQHQQQGYPGSQQQQQQHQGQQHQNQHQQGHQQQQQQSHGRPQHQGGQGHPSSPPHGPPGKTSHGGRQDLNQLNQHDTHYTDLRAQANRAGDAMGKAFDASHQAFASGDGARAKQLSEEGKQHQREMERLNGEASGWIFRKNNEDSQPGEIDLHGLYVKEAIRYTDQSIEEARRRGDSEIHLIVGKGLHSSGGMAKLKLAIEDLMRKHNLAAALDPHNAGVLIVHLDGQTRSGERSMGADDIGRQLERKDEQCVIM